MSCQITNNSNLEIEGFEDMIQSLVSFSQDRFGFEKPPSLFINSDPQNAAKVLGKTAYYDPQSMQIHIYADDRHPKDILRSISHELIHHKQNLDGQLNGDHYHGEGYAQKDDHMRDMEKQAYLNGNMCFRDWEDGYKQKQTIYNEWRDKQMSLKEWKNNELFGLLADKWGFGKNLIKEGLYEGEFPKGEPGDELPDLDGIESISEESEEDIKFRHKDAAMDDFSHIAKLHKDLVYDTYKKHEDGLLGKEDDSERHDDAEYDDATHIDDLEKDAHYDAEHDEMREMISNIVKEILNERR